MPQNLWYLQAKIIIQTESFSGWVGQFRGIYKVTQTDTAKDSLIDFSHSSIILREGIHMHKEERIIIDNVHPQTLCLGV